MKIAYFMPFKPMGHQNPSGDLIIGTELFQYLEQGSHTVYTASRMRSRWIYYNPLKLLHCGWEYFRLRKTLPQSSPDIWFTYHSYYKSPDILGPPISRALQIPYVIFQGVYSTKRRKSLKTWLGFQLNTIALKRAALVFTNKRNDEKNLLRLLPRGKVIYLPPGIHPGAFTFDQVSRKQVREQWQSGEKTVVMTTAMFRPGVKTQGIVQVIDACKVLLDDGLHLQLIIAGDGENRSFLEQQAAKSLGNHVTFLGKIPRDELYKYYSGADIFAFPGIDESLGMVYLEAQSCGLPVVACKNWGASEAVLHQKTGLLVDHETPGAFSSAIATLIREPQSRAKMASAAKLHIARTHTLKTNLATLENHLESLLRQDG